MILLTILATLALDRVLLVHRDSAVNAWYGRLADAIVARLPSSWNGIGGVLVLVLPPLIVIGLLQWLLAGWLFGLVSLVFAIIVLLFALGPLDVVNTVEEYIEARRNEDSERSNFYFERLTGEPPPASPQEEGRTMVGAILYQGHDHLFATLFWFCILGPMGAVFYRMAAEAALRPSPALVARPALQRSARDVLGVLGWLPARVVAFGYAMTGSFEAALRNLRGGGPPGADLLAENRGLLIKTGTAALRSSFEDEEEDTGVGERRTGDRVAAVDAARALGLRTAIFWLAVLALLTLGGWFG